MGIVKFVPLIAQVEETHINTCNFCKLAHNATFLYHNNVARAICDHIHVLIYVYMPLVPKVTQVAQT